MTSLLEKSTNTPACLKWRLYSYSFCTPYFVDFQTVGLIQVPPSSFSTFLVADVFLCTCLKLICYCICSGEQPFRETTVTPLFGNPQPNRLHFYILLLSLFVFGNSSKVIDLSYNYIHGVMLARLLSNYHTKTQRLWTRKTSAITK